MHQRATSRALFSPYPGNSEPHPLLADSLDGVDRKQLLMTMKSFLENDDSVVRAAVIPALRKLNDRDLAPLLPTLVNAVDKLAPTNEMWGDDIRQAGLDILSQRHIREGMLLCVSTIEWRWGLELQPRMNFLLRYGKSAREMLPTLKKIGRDLQKREEGQEPSDNQKILIKAIADIEASTEEAKLITLKDFIARETAQGKSASATKPGNRGKPLKVFILAGQSNMEGPASISTFDYIGDDPATAPLLKVMRGADGKPTVCDDVYISYLTGADANNFALNGKLTAGYGSMWGEDPTKPGSRIGPEFTFGLTMSAALDEPILIIKAAWGGKTLNTDFRSPGAGPFEQSKEVQEFWAQHPEGMHGVPPAEDRPKWLADRTAQTGVYYRLMMEHVKKVLADPKQVCPQYDPKQGFELAGFAWLQGWNDMCDGAVYPHNNYAIYSELLAHFIRDVRKDLKAPEMPFVIGVMGVGGISDQPNPFREAMAAPAAMPEFKGSVVAVQTAPFWSDELGAIDEKRAQVSQMRHLLDSKNPEHANADGKMTDEQKNEYMKKYEADLIPPADLAKWNRGASNAGYHYLGCAKTFALMGKAFAEANLAMMKQRNHP
jgi:alpha-galactosidase